MLLKQPFGPGIPEGEGRVWRTFNSPKFHAYTGVFATVAAIWPPHASLKAAPILVQVAFWMIGMPLFILTYALVHLAMIRICLRFKIATLWETAVMFLTVSGMIVPVLVIFPVLGIETGGVRDLAELVLFCFILFEIGAFGYLAFADRVAFPEIHAAPDAPPQVGASLEVFLRGTTLPVAKVEMIRSTDDGFEAYGMRQTQTAKRRFGIVLMELPVDLGFLIHRSIWISRDLAARSERDGRSLYVKLSNGKRLPVARSRQAEFENWLLLTQSDNRP